VSRADRGNARARRWRPPQIHPKSPPLCLQNPSADTPARRIDSEGGTRSKSRVRHFPGAPPHARHLIDSPPQTLPEQDYQPEDLPVWNFDGSSTGQAPGDNSDVYLKPVAIYPDPIRLGKNILVLAECWDSDGTPNKYNYRHETAKLMTAHADHIPWFGLEQEYTLLDLNERPYGW